MTILIAAQVSNQPKIFLWTLSTRNISPGRIAHNKMFVIFPFSDFSLLAEYSRTHSLLLLVTLFNSTVTLYCTESVFIVPNKKKTKWNWTNPNNLFNINRKPNGFVEKIVLNENVHTRRRRKNSSRLQRQTKTKTKK